MKNNLKLVIALTILFSIILNAPSFIMYIEETKLTKETYNLFIIRNVCNLLIRMFSLLGIFMFISTLLYKENGNKENNNS